MLDFNIYQFLGFSALFGSIVFLIEYYRRPKTIQCLSATSSSATSPVTSTNIDVQSPSTLPEDPTPTPSALVSTPTRQVTKQPQKQGQYNFLDYGFHEVQGRRDSMEDAHCLIPNFLENSDKPTGLFCVFDGHGGRRAADFASEQFPIHLKEALASPEGISPTDALHKAFLMTETTFMETAVANQYQDGTTGVVALIIGDQLIVGNVGDSEAIVCESGRAVSLTTVHNPQKNPEEAKRVEGEGGRIYMARVGHPALNVRLFNIAVSRAIGDILYKAPQYTQNKPSGLIAVPDTASVELSQDHKFLVLACDGLWDVLTHEDVVKFVEDGLANSKSLQQITTELVEEAENRESTDNITACIVWLGRSE